MLYKAVLTFEAAEKNPKVMCQFRRKLNTQLYVPLAFFIMLYKMIIIDLILWMKSYRVVIQTMNYRGILSCGIAYFTIQGAYILNILILWMKSRSVVSPIQVIQASSSLFCFPFTSVTCLHVTRTI